MGRICYSLKDTGADWCKFLAASRPGAAVEVRLDECDFDTDEIRDIFSCQRKAELIATCHVSLPSQVAEAAEKLSAAILAGADYVDIFTVYKGYEIEFIMTPNPEGAQTTELTEDQIRMCVDFLTEMDFVEA